MKILRLLAALSLLCGSAFGQSVDRRALGTNSFVTTIVNAQNPNGGGIYSKHWTNALGVLTTPTNSPIYAPHLASTDVIAHEFDVDILTGVPQTSDNSYALAGYNTLFPNGAAGVINNINGQVGVVGGAVLYNSGVITNGEATGVIGLTETSHSLGIGVVGTSLGLSTTTNIGVVGSVQGSGRLVGGYFETRSAKSSASRGLANSSVIIADNVDTTSSLFLGKTNNSSEVFKVNRFGDLSTIKSIAYVWPIARGGVNSALVDIDNAGGLVWSNLNPIAFGGIGPGTNNYLALFTASGINVTNSPISSSVSNVVKFFLPPNGGTHTNSGTNLWYGEFTGSGTNQWVELVVPQGHANQGAYLRTMAIGQISQRAPFTINDSLVIEPLTNQYGGHGVNGLIYPDNDAITPLGTTAKRFHGVNSDTFGFTATPNDVGVLFNDGAGGGHGFGISPLGALYLTGPGFAGIQFNSAGLLGAAILDVNTYGVGFGATVSNVLSSLRYGGVAGVVSVGTNSSVAAPTTVAIAASPASGTDKGGPDLRIYGGVSTGIGTNGNVRIQTAEKALATSSALNTATLKDRIFVFADPIILTTNSATIVFNATIPTALRGFGGTVTAHTEIENGVDIATLDEEFTISANRKGTTVVAGTPSAPLTSTSTSGGSAAIVNTWSLVANAQSVDLKLTCVTSGINSTNSTVRVTFIPNSSAVPVITHP